MAPKTAAEKLRDRYKCRYCKKMKSPAMFSNKQYEELAGRRGSQKANADPVVDGVMACKACLSQQVQELDCQGCNTTKELGEFAKVHRRNPDNAFCMVCMEGRAIRENREEHIEIIEEDDDDDLDLPDGRRLDGDDLVSLYGEDEDEIGASGVSLRESGADNAGRMQDTFQSDAPSGWVNQSNRTMTGAGSSSAGWQTVSKQSRAQKSNAPGSEAGILAYQTGRYGQPKMPSSSVVSSAPKPSPKKKGRGFAKVKVYKEPEWNDPEDEAKSSRLEPPSAPRPRSDSDSPW